MNRPIFATDMHVGEGTDYPGKVRLTAFDTGAGTVDVTSALGRSGWQFTGSAQARALAAHLLRLADQMDAGAAMVAAWEIEFRPAPQSEQEAA